LKLFNKKEIIGMYLIIFYSYFNLLICININELIYIFASSIVIFQSIPSCVLYWSKMIVKMQGLEGR